MQNQRRDEKLWGASAAEKRGKQTTLVCVAVCVWRTSEASLNPRRHLAAAQRLLPEEPRGDDGIKRQISEGGCVGGGGPETLR
ncbi:hypothetical protein Q8A73_004122 [Channa argus]|nr:hypothetical protein Q8A73_004122 [Channa argus]